ncbi:MAG: hypothetical protein ACE5FT_03515 [Candidatus Nanoarchaeia archaeon]
MGFTLTLDNIIRLYTGGLIDPREDVSKHFTNVDITGGFKGGPDMFYIASSRERVKIPRRYIGYVPATDYTEGNKHLGSSDSTQYIHMNAPWIDPSPCFEGKVTFEIVPIKPRELRPGMRLAELVLHRLHESYRHSEELTSRYHGQDNAQLGKEDG